MATPSTREEFKDYCLRRLGHPVVEINVDELQMEDRIDDALRFWQEYHFDGTEQVYITHKVLAEDITNKYLTLTGYENSIIGISRMLKTTGQTTNMFSIRYQMAFNDIATYSTRGVREMSNYWMRLSHLNMISDLITGMSNIRFNRKTNNLHIDWDWSTDISAGDYIVLEAHQKVGEVSELWGDTFLKNYATALIKEQWGTNLSKFEGVQLPGGVTLNGRAILEDARIEIERLKEQMSLSFELPVDFLVG